MNMGYRRGAKTNCNLVGGLVRQASGLFQRRRLEEKGSSDAQSLSGREGVEGDLQASQSSEPEEAMAILPDSSHTGTGQSRVTVFEDGNSQSTPHARERNPQTSIRTQRTETRADNPSLELTSESTSSSSTSSSSSGNSFVPPYQPSTIDDSVGVATNEIFFDSSRMCDLETAEESVDASAHTKSRRLSSHHEIQVHPELLPRDSSSLHSVPSSRSSSRSLRFSTSQQLLGSSSSFYHSSMRSTLGEMKSLIDQLVEARGQCTEVMEDLQEQIWWNQKEFVKAGGLDALWTLVGSSEDADLVLTCLDMVWILCLEEKDKLVRKVDALVIAMQKWLSDPEIQVMGCRILSHVPWQRGADACALRAVYENPESKEVLEWGLRALDEISRYGGTPSKRAMLRCQVSQGGLVNGADIVRDILESTAGQRELAEVAFRLFEGLSQDHEAANLLGASCISDILTTVRQHRRSPECRQLLLFAYLSMNNLTVNEWGHVPIDVIDAITISMEILQMAADDHTRLGTEVCRFVAGLLAKMRPSMSFIPCHGLTKVLTTIATGTDTEILEACMYMLTALWLSSEASMRTVFVDVIDSFVEKVSPQSLDSTKAQLLFFGLSRCSIDCMCKDKPSRSSTIESVGAVIELSDDTAVVEAGLQILVLLIQKADQRTRTESTSTVQSVFLTIGRDFPESCAIQSSACHLLWALGNDTRELDPKAANACIEATVSCLLLHSYSASAVDFACGALSTLLHTFPSLRTESLSTQVREILRKISGLLVESKVVRHTQKVLAA